MIICIKGVIYLERKKLITLLERYGQQHLLSYYDALVGEEKNKFAKQIEKVDWKLITRVHEKQKDHKRGHFEPIEGMSLKQIEENKEGFSEVGLEMIRAGKIGAVLLAGGQGTRLGCEGPKGVVNVGISKDLYIFELLFRNLMEVTRKAGTWVPLYIMTSEKNHNETVAFLKEHHFFQYPEEYVIFFVQEMVPSVDFEGRLFMEKPDGLSLSPNGNGGWFSSMVKAGLLEDLQKRGVEWLNIFAVDNVLQQIIDPAFIGATIKLDYVSGAKVVRKAEPNERVGVLCLEDSKPSIVEYYEMIDEMIHKRNSQGELSYTFGVILNYVFRVDKLKKILDTSMPIHMVERKIPFLTEDGQYIVPENPNGYKFEELVLDMIHLLDNCLPFEVVREKEFAPIKNATGVDSLESARELLKKNGVDL
jgi:UDP-N-acetylglucosamine/UDP-N-acetylgalactosamine diphosphorylase